MLLMSEKIDKVLPAIAKVKSELKAVTKGSSNPFFKSKYADLNTYLDEVEPLLEKNGLLLMQPPVIQDSNTVTSVIFHVESGQYMAGNMKLIGENDMQKAGSGITYARRYILGGLLSMQAVDDDGNVAANKTNTTKTITGTASTTNFVQTSSSNANTTTKTDIPTTKTTARPSFRRPTKTTTVEETPSGDDL